MHSLEASWSGEAQAAAGATVRYHQSVSKLQAFDHLGAGPFDRAAWYGLLADHAKEPVVAIADGACGSAALALTRNGSRLESLHHWFAFTWRPHAPEGPIGAMLLETLARDLKARTHHVAFDCLPDEDGSATRLARAFRAAGWMVRLSPCDENHVLDVDGRSFAEYWAGRPGRMRTTLKRKGHKVDVAIATRFEAADWDAYRAIYARSWKQAEADAALLEAFARAEGAAGRLRMGITRHQGVPVAAQFWTVEGDTAYIHKLAYDEGQKHLSAGTTLSAALFRHVIDTDKVALVDFGTGRDGYKRDWMDTVRLRYALTCIDWRQPRGLATLSAKLADRVTTTLRLGLPLASPRRRR